ncbi:MAG: molybdopterin-dependent oxidoreductase [Methanomicrobiales archaeon]
MRDNFLIETAQIAEIDLPVACFDEKDSTQISTERRVQKWRKAQEPPGEAKADWQIFDKLAKVMGYETQIPHKNPG